MAAAYNGDIGILKTLVQGSADVTLCNVHGDSPMSVYEERYGEDLSDIIYVIQQQQKIKNSWKSNSYNSYRARNIRQLAQQRDDISQNSGYAKREMSRSNSDPHLIRLGEKGLVPGDVVVKEGGGRCIIS